MESSPYTPVSFKRKTVNNHVKLVIKVANSHGISFGWTWIARLLNMKPRKITPSLMHTFFEIAGNALMSEYKEQGFGIVKFVCEVYLNMIPEKAIAAKTRLVTISFLRGVYF